ncbi:MAG: tetratricopeptide repeat protein [Saprospiraceae bacterium]|nr:tetratricopeptide repeat protein [Saprospiraceae bacterium]
MNGRTFTLFLIGSILSILALGECTPKASQSDIAFLNLHDSVQYVGMETCRSCHANVYETFIQTGMGRSFGMANHRRSNAAFDNHSLVYDSISNFFYFPFLRDSSMYIREFRLDGLDTIHNRVERIDFIVGSGHHTNSHIIQSNGYLYQAPITFYTQEGRWDMAPGYEDGNNSRFSRILTTECITCHNHLPEHVPGSENKYSAMPEGIACERCHGPGKLHVEAMLSGKMVDTSKVADRTIVNPRRLPRNLQTDICQRCHLQGIAVLQPGKTFFDFRPGMALSEVMNVFLPRYTDSDERFIMASQADRLRQSKCYLKSEELTCITCHHPHFPVGNTAKEKYNKACQNCHAGKGCSAPAQARKEKSDDCAGCHMPRSSSIDIPHVSITDHFIRKDYSPAKTNINSAQKGQFLGLQSLTKTNTSPVEMAEGYIALFDKFIPDPSMLDSAAYWLERAKDPDKRLFPVRVHLLFAKGDNTGVVTLAANRDTATLDNWTSYRIGQAYLNSTKHRLAERFLIRAANQSPFNLDFQEKLGIVKGLLGKIEEAERIFRWVLLEDPSRPLSLTNLGYIRAVQQDYTGARAFYLKALSLDPDQAQAKENLKALEGVTNKRAGLR